MLFLLTLFLQNFTLLLACFVTLVFLLRHDLAQHLAVGIPRKAGTVRLTWELAGAFFAPPGALLGQDLWGWGPAVCVLPGSPELEKHCLRYRVHWS